MPSRKPAGTRKGFAIRDPDSTTYSGTIETAAEFGKRIYREALQRGWSRAKKRVVIGDGAEWIWNLSAEHFPELRRGMFRSMTPGHTSTKRRA